jgi:allophanate hydrolase
LVQYWFSVAPVREGTQFEYCSTFSQTGRWRDPAMDNAAAWAQIANRSSKAKITPMETISELVEAHKKQPELIVSTIERSLGRLAAADDPAIFIHLADKARLLNEVRQLATGNLDLPLLGIPVAVKDNIDVAGMPTTAACPAYAYMPERDAESVARLRKAGAIVIGKTNLDQFATGLVGTRSPYGTPRNPFRADLVPGGSSSGSGVAVARGIVPLALGTDTAGSGRIPAGLNNIVGLKPTCGLVPASGVVPACRSLDCVSIFTLTVADAWTALEVMAGEDARDAYSRPFDLRLDRRPVADVTLAVPRPQDRHFFGDATAQTSFERALDQVRALVADVVEVDIAYMLAVARLLYEGPWLAERAAAVGVFIREHENASHPVTRGIIEKGWAPTAVEAFQGQYQVAELRARTRRLFEHIDALMVPTAPTAYTVADLQADPLGPNACLGTYTNFVNLLDLAGIAVPASLGDDGIPRGVTFLVPAGEDALAARLGSALHAQTQLPIGCRLADLPQQNATIGSRPHGIELAVVGAHLTGLPLNRELTDLQAHFVETTTTTSDYRLFALPGTTPPKPGLLRVATGTGQPIEVEIWSLSDAAFGKFVGAIPGPLSIGSLRLAGGRSVKGFLVEAEAVTTATDISRFGGWRAYLAQQ